MADQLEVCLRTGHRLGGGHGGCVDGIGVILGTTKAETDPRQTAPKPTQTTKCHAPIDRTKKGAVQHESNSSK